MSLGLLKIASLFFVSFILIPDCGGVEYARNNGILVILFPKTKDESNGLSPSDLVDTLKSDYLLHFLQLYLTLRGNLFFKNCKGT